MTTNRAIAEEYASIDPTKIVTPAIRAALQRKTTLEPQHREAADQLHAAKTQAEAIEKNSQAATARLIEIRAERGPLCAQILLGLESPDSDDALRSEEARLTTYVERVKLGRPHVQELMQPLITRARNLSHQITSCEEEIDQRRENRRKQFAERVANA